MKVTIPARKRYIFTTWEGGGNVSPAMTVARKLSQLGHCVRFMCDESARGEAVANGIEFRSWKEAPNRPDRKPASCPVRDWEVASPPEGVQRLMDRIMIGPALAYAQDLIAELDREPADLVLTSEMLPGVMAACESRGQAFAILAVNLCFYPFPGMPAFGPGLPPPQTEEERALQAQTVDATIQMFDTGLERLNAARHQLGLAPLMHVADQALGADAFLLGTSRSFDFPVDVLPPQIRYVGPLLDEPSWTKNWEPQGDAQLPLVAVGFSTTFQNHAATLQKVIDAAASLPIRVLVTRGPVSECELRPAANTWIVESAPHNEVMKHASIVVTHGGHGTVMRALAHKRPMLLIPHGRDQNENAIRVTERGAGLSLPLDANVEEIRFCLEQLLENAAFKDSATKLGNAIETGEGDIDLVSLLEALAAKRCQPIAS